MNLKTKAAMIAKAIGVWWGIFLILGCCAGFTIKVLYGLFYAAGGAEKFDIKIFVPLMILGSLVLAVISYCFSIIIDGAPYRKLRRQLDRVLKEKGLCREYTDILSANKRPELKNKVNIELAIAYNVLDETELARESLDKIDVVSVLDIAQSTGDYTDAAYYYAAAIMLFIRQNDIEQLKTAYENGSFYIDKLDADSFVMAAKAWCLLKLGSSEEDIPEILSKAGSKKLMYGRNKFIRNFVLYSRTYILYALELYNEAENSAMEAMETKLSPVIEKELIGIIRKIRGLSADETAENKTL